MVDSDALLDRYDAITDAVLNTLPDSEREPLVDMASRLRQFGSFLTERQEKFFGVLLRKAEKAAKATPKAEEIPATLQGGPEGQIARLEAALKAARDEVVRLSRDLDAKRQEQSKLLADIDFLGKKNEDLRAELGASKAAPASAKVDVLALERAAAFASQNVRDAILVALKAQLVPTSPVQLQANVLAPEGKVRALELDEAPQPKASEPSDEARAKVVADAKAARDAAHAEAVKTVTAPSAEALLTDTALVKLVDEVVTQDAKQTEAERRADLMKTGGPYAVGAGPLGDVAKARKPAPRLARCPRCKAFAIGKHTCR